MAAKLLSIGDTVTVKPRASATKANGDAYSREFYRGTIQEFKPCREGEGVLIELTNVDGTLELNDKLQPMYRLLPLENIATVRRKGQFVSLADLVNLMEDEE